MGKIKKYLLNVTANEITWQTSLFPIGSLDKLLIPIGQLYQLQYNFRGNTRLLEGRREIFCGAL
jgi:hypothetical protein